MMELLGEVELALAVVVGCDPWEFAFWVVHSVAFARDDFEEGLGRKPFFDASDKVLPKQKAST